jgi:hypothetical protein
MKTLLKICLLTAAALTLSSALTACGDDSGDTDLLPPKHDMAVAPEDLRKPVNLDAESAD